MILERYVIEHTNSRNGREFFANEGAHFWTSKTFWMTAFFTEQAGIDVAKSIAETQDCSAAAVKAYFDTDKCILTIPGYTEP